MEIYVHNWILNQTDLLVEYNSGIFALTTVFKVQKSNTKQRDLELGLTSSITIRDVEDTFVTRVGG